VKLATQQELYLHSFTRKEMKGEDKGGIERRGGQEEGEDGGRG
jgi:hypothetical protein